MALAILLAVLSFPVCALAVAIQLLVGTDYVRWTMARPGYPPSPGFSREERLAIKRSLLRREGVTVGTTRG